MDFKKFISDVKPHAMAIFLFFMVGYVYYYQTFKGFTHKEDDVTQGLIKGTEINKYTSPDGEFPGWTNSIFSGMPSVMIQGKVSGNEIKSYNYLTPVNSTSYPFKILFLSLIGFYLLMNAFKVKPEYGALAAVAYGFATYSLSSVEAAHYTKVLAMALMPAILAAMHWLFSGRFLLGGVMLAFNLALQIYFFHYQITFYSIICMLVMGIYYIVELSREKKFRLLGIATTISILAVALAVLSNVTKIKSTSKFAEDTMRGGNDMAKVDEGVKQKETGKSGLDRDYAFSWSYGKGETFTLLIPNFYGGSSREKLSKSSKFYEVTQNDEAIEQGLPMYHGDLTYTSGPIYIGAIIIFLFVLGIIVIRSPIKWPLLILTLISFILGWGRHFGIVNNLLFEHLPYFNKFRTPMMGFCIAQVTIPLLGFLGLKYIYENLNLQKTSSGPGPKNPALNTQKKDNKLNNELWDKIKLAFYIVGGFCLLMAIIGPELIDMGGIVDEEYKKSGNANIIPVFEEDRGSLLRKDAFRSLIYIAIAFGALWAWYSNKIQKSIAVAIIAGFAAIDLIGVDWRYLSWDDFIHEKGTATEIPLTPADQEILQDKDLHYRVFDLSRDPFNNNDGAAYHKMIGGYDPAKLSRYQDLISEFLSQRDMSDKGLDMLNCKYMIASDSTGRKGVIPRTTNNGNAWFVSKLTQTDDASKEMSALKKIDNKREATFNKSFERNEKLSSLQFNVDSSAFAKLISYHPDTMKYEVSNLNPGYLVFSEIYYDDWMVMVDGKKTDLNKVNYALRGLSVPAGKHSVVMYFNKGVSTTDKIEQFSSIAILLAMLIMIVLWLRTYFRTPAVKSGN